MVSALADICDQSSLVALNAGIEAARAGTGGRGLAVVAADATKLSERITEAIAHLNGMIADIRRDASQAVAVLEQVDVGVTEGTKSAIRAGVPRSALMPTGSVTSWGRLRTATGVQEEVGKGAARSSVELGQLA